MGLKHARHPCKQGVGGLIASRIPPGQVLRSRVLLFGVVAGLVYLVVLVFLVRVLCCRRRGRLSRVSRLSR